MILIILGSVAVIALISLLIMDILYHKKPVMTKLDASLVEDMGGMIIMQYNAETNKIEENIHIGAYKYQLYRYLMNLEDHKNNKYSWIVPLYAHIINKEEDLNYYVEFF